MQPGYIGGYNLAQKAIDEKIRMFYFLVKMASIYQNMI